MLSQLVLGRAMMQVAHIDLAGIAADRCARRSRHLRWLRRCIDIPAAVGRDAQAWLRQTFAQRATARTPH